MIAQDTVASVDLEAKKAKLSSGEKEVEFTVVVFATGAEGPFPGDTRQTEVEPLLREMSEAAGELEKADSVAIVGGGPVGIGTRFNSMNSVLPIITTRATSGVGGFFQAIFAARDVLVAIRAFSI